MDDAALARYLAARERQRFERIQEAFGRLSRREQALVREAAVMGYVQGNMHRPGWVLDKTPIPSDAQIVTTVVGACLSMDDRYPVIARGRLPRRPRKAQP